MIYQLHLIEINVPFTKILSGLKLKKGQKGSINDSDMGADINPT